MAHPTNPCSHIILTAPWMRIEYAIGPSAPKAWRIAMFVDEVSMAFDQFAGTDQAIPQILDGSSEARATVAAVIRAGLALITVVLIFPTSAGRPFIPGRLNGQKFCAGHAFVAFGAPWMPRCSIGTIGLVDLIVPDACAFFCWKWRTAFAAFHSGWRHARATRLPPAIVIALVEIGAKAFAGEAHLSFRRGNPGVQAGAETPPFLVDIRIRQPG